MIERRWITNYLRFLTASKIADKRMIKERTRVFDVLVLAGALEVPAILAPAAKSIILSLPAV